MQEERSGCQDHMVSGNVSDNDDAESSASGDSAMSAVSAAASEAPGRRSSRLQVALYAVFCVLIVAAGASPVLAFRFLRESENKNFRSEFRQVADGVLDSVGRNMASVVNTAESLSLTVTSFAVETNATWPTVLLPMFDFLSQSAAALPPTLNVVFLPIVHEKDRELWENYVANNTGWIEEAMKRQAALKEEGGSRRLWMDDHTSRDLDNINITNRVEFVPAKSKDGVLVEIYAIASDGTRYREVIPGPYAPAWQFHPLSKRGINYNYKTNALNFPVVNNLLATGKPIIGPPIDFVGEQYYQEAEFFQFLLRESTGNQNLTYNGTEPTSTLFFPVFDKFSGEEREVVGMIAKSLFWLYFFESILPDNDASVYGVMRDKCGRGFTVLIKGSTASFMGMGDMHDKNYDENVVAEASFAEIVDRSGITSIGIAGRCPYTLSVYPTKEFSDRHLSMVPIIAAASVSVLFLFAALVLASYEIVLRRRLKRIKKVARESGGLVSELYPAEVRERMLERMRSSRAASVETNRNRFSSVQLVKRALSGSRAAVVIRNVIRVEQERVVRRESLMTLDGGPQEEPIADSFPDCTVMFSYLHGFDEWCTGHDPQDIFVLLEKVFGCLDAIARRYKVFKINTIFDSYFAACGLPRPQPDHALRMSKFARDGLGAVRDLLTTELVDMFGAGTSNMHLRIGLHSGRVTAGLLAVDRVRFDVFGDTVNTSSRIAASGLPGRIHVSPTTAAELVSKFGKSKWLTEREDPVMLKGKGEMTTYWLRPRSADLTKWGSSTSSVLASELESSESTVAVDVHPSKPEFDNSSLGPFGSASSTFSLGLPFQSKSMEMIESRKRGSEILLGLYEQFIEEEEEIVFEPDSD